MKCNNFQNYLYKDTKKMKKSNNVGWKKEQVVDLQKVVVQDVEFYLVNGLIGILKLQPKEFIIVKV